MTQGTADMRAGAGRRGTLIRNIAIGSGGARLSASMNVRSRHALLLAGALLNMTCVFGGAARSEELPSYASVRTDVSIQPSARAATDQPRPKGFFQLAGTVNSQLCSQTLEAFNEAGQYRGDDTTRWLLDSPRQIVFGGLTLPSEPGSLPSLEHARTDLNADGTNEHVYRLNSVVKSQLRQRLMIVPEELHRSPWLVARYSAECNRVNPDAGCGSIMTLIEFGITARLRDRLASEWQFTKNDAMRAAIGDDDSRELIYLSRNKLRRNLGDVSAYWSLYQIKSAVVAVAAPAPVLDFAPPELLVFAPSATQSGVLQCVLMPVAWHVTEARE